MSHDDGTAGMATGSDEGAPGEGRTPEPVPGDEAVLDALLTDDGDDVVQPVEDAPATADAAENDSPLAALAADGAPDADPDAVAFREPAAD